MFADLVQNSVAMDTRMNVTFTPTLTLEVFAQPFIASGRYTNFKEFAEPRSREKLVYGADLGSIAADGSDYRVDPDGAGPASAFTIGNPDFNFRSLRGNAVLRWEFSPGSTLFPVWTQSRSTSAEVGDFRLGRDFDAPLDTPADNIFLLQVNYWLGF